MECQIDCGELGLLLDPSSGRRRMVHALVFTAVYSRHMFVWLTHSLNLEAVIVGCETAWVLFGGVFKILIPDNMKPIVAEADAVNPRLTLRRRRPMCARAAAGRARSTSSWVAPTLHLPLSHRRRYLPVDG